MGAIQLQGVEKVIQVPHTVPDRPLVSVCVQTYNHATYIRECLAGILMQHTSFEFEVLLGEDASSDGTREICIEYAEKHPDRIRLFLHDRENVVYIDGTPTGRYNLLFNLSHTNGTYIALCEGDDYWTDPLKLQKQVNFLEANLDCVSCHHWQKYAVKNGNGQYIEVEAPQVGQGYLARAKSNVGDIFANRLRIKTRTHMFRNILPDIPDWFSEIAYGDVPLSMILGKHGSFGFIDEPMAVYRQTDNGVSKMGRDGKSDRAWIEYHFKEWIKIWDLGNRYHQDKYLAEAVSTVIGFYGIILTSNGNSPLKALELTLYSFFRQRGSVTYRAKISSRLLKLVVIKLVLRIKSRLR